jgi:hypothetical protein
MTSIERTAYPRLKRRPSTQELADVYTPTVEDLAFIHATARGPSSTLTLAVLFKVFQRLGHLPRLQDVPFAIVSHVRSSLRLPSDTRSTSPRARCIGTTSRSARTFRSRRGALRRAMQPSWPCTRPPRSRSGTPVSA